MRYERNGLTLILVASRLIIANLRGLDRRAVNQMEQIFQWHRLLRAEMFRTIFFHQNKGKFVTVNAVVVIHAAEGAGISKNGNPDITLFYACCVGHEPLALELEVGVGGVSGEEQQATDALGLNSHNRKGKK
jgi:hypothetical protein